MAEAPAASNSIIAKIIRQINGTALAPSASLRCKPLNRASEPSSTIFCMTGILIAHTIPVPYLGRIEMRRHMRQPLAEPRLKKKDLPPTYLCQTFKNYSLSQTWMPAS